MHRTNAEKGGRMSEMQKADNKKTQGRSIVVLLLAHNAGVDAQGPFIFFLHKFTFLLSSFFGFVFWMAM